MNSRVVVTKFKEAVALLRVLGSDLSALCASHPSPLVAAQAAIDLCGSNSDSEPLPPREFGLVFRDLRDTVWIRVHPVIRGPSPVCVAKPQVLWARVDAIMRRQEEFLFTTDFTDGTDWNEPIRDWVLISGIRAIRGQSPVWVPRLRTPPSPRGAAPFLTTDFTDGTDRNHVIRVRILPCALPVIRGRIQQWTI